MTKKQKSKDELKGTGNFKKGFTIKVPVGEGPAKRFSTEKDITITRKDEGPTKKHTTFEATIDGKKIKDANWQNKTLQIRKSTGGRVRAQTGGRALRGYGRAFKKGGKA